MARKHANKISSKQAELGLTDIRTALYIRVSTVKQAEEGFGLEAQRNELDKYCAAQGWTVAPEHIYIDAGISGKTDERPAFQAMLDAAQAGQIQRIVATKLDRVARNLKNLLQTVDTLKGYGCALVIKKEQFDTSTPQGLFVMQMLGAVGELERSMIGERVHSGRAENARQGGYNGAHCPLGYQYNNGVFTIVDEQAQTVQTIFNMFLSGQLLRTMAAALNEANTPTATGGQWYASTVRYILGNGQYAGLAQWDGEEVAAALPAIIAPELYEEAQARLECLPRGRPAIAA
jgi:site-specific DNA recombinase